MVTTKQSSVELLATVATVNDLHFGETVCGLLEGVDAGPTLQVGPGEEPYPTTMNRAAAGEISVLSPDALVCKGDLTATGAALEYAEFEATYSQVRTGRLIVTAGNHDKPSGGSGVPDFPPVQSADLPGVTIAVLDTARPGRPGGRISATQAGWLDELASRADRPVLVFGHHPLGGEDMTQLFGPHGGDASSLDRESSERIVSVVARRPRIAGYFAGHTHRNRVRHHPETGVFPWVEVACVKDFPGSWAEYRIYADRIAQIHHRISSDPAAVRWSERCRAMFGGLYPGYALGREDDRRFQISLREA